MGTKIRLGLLVVLGALVAGMGVFLASRPAVPPGYSVQFRLDGPYPAEYPTLQLEADGAIEEEAVARMLTQIPGQANLVAVITSNDGTVRQEWRWQNGAWKRSDTPAK
jgi:hypothetical protein